MFNSKKLTAILSLGLILVAGIITAQRRQVVLDRVVAIVGGSAILYSEVLETADQLTQQRREAGYTSDRDPINEGLEELMKQKLLYNQSLIDSIPIGGDVNSFVEEQLQAMIAEAGSIADFERIQHMPIFNYREILRQKISEQEGAQAMQRDVVSDITVTPGEVQRFFDTLTTEELPIIPEQYVYAHIVRYPSSQEEAKQRTRERLLEMRERIITGKSTMPILARTYSVDHISAIRGGELDPTPLEQLAPPFADALEKLKPGQISEVVETEYGFHIIELLDEPKNRQYHFRHILLRPTFTSDELMEPVLFLDSLANQIRTDSISFEEAAKKYSEDGHSKMNGGVVTNHDILMSNAGYSNVKLSRSKFKREDFGYGLGQQDYMMLSRMKTNEVSDAFMTEDIRANNLGKIIKLLEVIPTHPASLTADYIEIERMALNAKQEKVFNAWLKEKIDGFYIYIDPEFRNGEFMFPNWVK
jgi:peptidyl-prolyl cis-trans isomerase SurA